MNPQLATIFCILLILFLFIVDRKTGIEGVSKAIYAPFFWMFLAGSRFVTQWLHLGSPIDYSSEMYLEGSPLDRAVFIMLLLIGAAILARRHLKLKTLFGKNVFIILFFAFSAASILWSRYPVISLKRLIKTFGNVIMALIILTEERPDQALGAILRRLGFLLLPLSILFIKYYPNIGRQYHVNGAQMYVGVATQKNQLGQLCLIIGVYFCWSLFVNTSTLTRRAKLWKTVIFAIMAPIIGWVFYMANSATSMMCFAVALCVIAVSRLPGMAKKPKRILSFGITIIVSFLLLESTLGLSRLIIVNVLRRDISLTTRVPMWYGLMKMAGNPIVGVGYESFWLGERLEYVWRTFDTVHQAHNGYLETYLNLGFVGLFLIVSIVITGFSKIKRQLTADSPFALFKLMFLVVIAVYNWTEATFFGVNNIWLMMFVVITDMQGQQRESVVRAGDGYAQSAEQRGLYPTPETSLESSRVTRVT